MSKKTTTLQAQRSGQPGRVVFVCASKFSKAFSSQAAKDFQSGKVQNAGQILLPDGQIITAGPTYETTMSSELLQMVKDGALQASTFGKLLSRRGKPCQQPRDMSTMLQLQ